MNTLNRSIAYLSLAGLLIIGSVSAANAQRGGHGGGFRGGFRGGFSNIGFSYGNPGIGTGFGLGFHGFYSPHIYANIGLQINALPFGYYPFFWGSSQYYYNDGIFYQPYSDGVYQVATPPVGAQVPSLPANASSIVIDGKQYFEFNGVYYEQVVNDDGKTVYMVAGKDGVLNTGQNAGQDSGNYHQTPQVGDMTDQLPNNTHKVNVNGKKYWVTPDNIYLEKVKVGDKTSYRVSSVPDDTDQSEPTQGDSNL
ncbi:DUF6515 family protein [Mucilaginibacter sp. SP1R1]|uniref:DUF6515 family protein n=1 Tax=Mucilaginibacter sp. SP1R1 TaxID=2723091 RepID=UPI00161BFAEE|nr:DUF6515 family protein [Mucilaginibacter sp. SP1R1]MBB6148541.1 hypothetical protein [Mucilaginibacter sp. SP1R1]